MKNLYGLAYQNGKTLTNMPYKQLVFTSKREATREAKNMRPWVKKNLQVVRLTLETV
jgi:hypothetical protein